MGLMRKLSRAWEVGQALINEPHLGASQDGEDFLIDEGPDDLWPADKAPCIPSGTMQSPEQIEQTNSEPQLIVSPQWGIVLPSGSIAWQLWQEHNLNDPFERLRLVGAIQQTAIDIGLATGEQSAGFLSHYGWVTRNQIATVVYEDTGAYSLTDARVSKLHPLAEEDTDEHTDESSDDPEDLGRSVHQGPVGGDAQRGAGAADDSAFSGVQPATPPVGDAAPRCPSDQDEDRS